MNEARAPGISATNPTDAEALRSLRSDQRLEKLNRHIPSLALIRTLGVARDEVAHSRLLAMLLDPQRHRGAEIMLRVLLRGILSRNQFTNSIGERIRIILEDSWTEVTVHREFLHIDVVVYISCERGAAVIGIENKIDAGERPQQLRRYQEKLQRAYPDVAAVMVFLTPTGREPTTALSDSQVPTVSVGYDSVLAAVEEALRHTERGSRNEHVLSEIIAHLREDILGEDPEVRTLARELWRTHGRALRIALEHRPRLEDIRDMYETLLKEKFGDDTDTYYWKSKGELREIKMSLPSWGNTGFPFEFMLRVNGERLPEVRLLLWRDGYNAHASHLREWARSVNVSAGPLIDEEFRPFHGWGWRRVFLEENHPPDAVLDEQSFDEATAIAAVDSVVELFEKLQPHINAP